jgi:hypothetical protein
LFSSLRRGNSYPKRNNLVEDAAEGPNIRFVVVGLALKKEDEDEAVGSTAKKTRGSTCKGVENVHNPVVSTLLSQISGER